MFEFIRTHQRLMQFALLLFIFPSFAFFGLQSYSRFREHENAVAKVAGQSITQQEWDAAQRSQLERLRQMFGGQFDQKMFDTPEARRAVLDNLIAQRVVAATAAREHLTVSDRTLQETILGIPGLVGQDGKFDVERYRSLLAAQGLTPAAYEASLRHDLAVQQVTGAIQDSAFAPKAVADRLSDLNAQEREVQEILFKPSDYASQVKVTDDMLKAYYDKHTAQFEVPEQIKADYVVLDIDALSKQISVSDADAKTYYDQNLKQYTEGEQVRARHILIKVPKDASATEQAAAKQKAEKLLADVRKNPSDFAQLAKKYSQDPGSAAAGGDLGFFGKGMMVKPFEDAAFQLKKGQISDLVKTDYGYHIIEVTDVKPATVKPFDAVKADIISDIKKQQAARKFSSMADSFSNTVYEQADSLKPVADKLSLKVQTVSGLTRTPNPALPKDAPYNQEKFLKALFADDAVKNKHNTDAVEVAPNTLIAGHVIEYKPVTKRPFDEVKNLVRERVTASEEEALARKAGMDRLAALKSGGDANGFGAAKTVSRANPQNIDSAAFAPVMRADASKLPAFVGADLDGHGYAVYRINKVTQPATRDEARRKAEQQQIAGVLAQEEVHAYLEALKKKSKVEILVPPGTGKDGDNNGDSH